MGDSRVWEVSDGVRRRVAETTAMPMFCLALAFLVVLTILVVLWVDVPMVFTPHEGESIDQPVTDGATTVHCWISAQTALESGYHCLLVLYLLWPLFFLEFFGQFICRDRTRPFWRERYPGLLICFCPPLRMCARHPDKQNQIWFPHLGWRDVNSTLREQLEKQFSVPMIFIALTILPVLLIDVGMKQQVQSRPWLQFLLHASMALIWFAFAAEFIVMVSVAERKWKYCRDHWLDLAIILLPVISFLRSLRIVRATRVARLAKIQQLSRMGRLYRLRGLAMRALRALMILQLLNRLFRIGPERQLQKLRALLAEKQVEIQALNRQIAELERRIEQQKRQSMEAQEKCEVV